MIFPKDSLYSVEITEVEKIITDNTPSVKKSFITDSINHRQLQSLSLYARTGVDGKYAFDGLPAEKSFEVLPLKPGFEFGVSKGFSAYKKSFL